MRVALAQHRDTWQWPAKVAQVPAEKLHLTLHFIGDVERKRLPELQQQLRISFEPFTLQLDYAEFWPHGIAVLRPHLIPPALVQLQAALGGELQRLALPVDTREFHPHVTLARRANEAVLPQRQPFIDWPVDGYVLVESEFEAHRRYTIHAHFFHSRSNLET